MNPLNRCTETGAKLSRWFPERVRPVRVGAYRVDSPKGTLRYSFWNGRQWGYREMDPSYAYQYRHEMTLGPIRRWRGLAQEPK